MKGSYGDIVGRCRGIQWLYKDFPNFVVIPVAIVEFLLECGNIRFTSMGILL